MENEKKTIKLVLCAVNVYSTKKNITSDCCGNTLHEKCIDKLEWVEKIVKDGRLFCKCHGRFEGRTINMVAHPSMVAMSNRDIQLIMSDNEELRRRAQFLERRHNEMQVVYNEAEMEALREDAFAWRFLQNQHEAAASVVAVAQNDVQMNGNGNGNGNEYGIEIGNWNGKINNEMVWVAKQMNCVFLIFILSIIELVLFFYSYIVVFNFEMRCDYLIIPPTPYEDFFLENAISVD